MSEGPKLPPLRSATEDQPSDSMERQVARLASALEAIRPARLFLSTAWETLTFAVVIAISLVVGGMSGSELILPSLGGGLAIAVGRGAVSVWAVRSALRRTASETTDLLRFEYEAATSGRWRLTVTASGIGLGLLLSVFPGVGSIGGALLLAAAGGASGFLVATLWQWVFLRAVRDHGLLD